MTWTTNRRTRVAAASGLVVLLASVGTGVAHAGGRAAPSHRPAPSAHPSAAAADPFDAPSGLTFSDGDLWVSDRADSSLTEVDPAGDPKLGGTSPVGRVVRTVHAQGIDHPSALTSSGGDLWVLDGAGGPAGTGAVTERRGTDGSELRRVSGAAYRLQDPVAMKTLDGMLVVVDAGRGTADGAVTEIDTSTGRLVRVLSGTRFHFDRPDAVAVSGEDAWITDEGDDTVTEIDVATGRLVRTVTGPGLAGPDGIALQGGDAWVADGTSSALTQIDAATGTVEATWNDSEAGYGFGNPTVVTATGGSVYVATPLGTSPMVTRVPADKPSNPSWYMCNTNGPYYFSELSAFAVSGRHLWVASRSGANWQPTSAASATGSLTEMDTVTGGLYGTLP